MADDPALIWDQPRRSPRRRRPAEPAAEPAPDRPPEPPTGVEPPGGRITLAEAHHQFGVTTSTLGAWARDGKVDAVKEAGRWMVTPASVAARISDRRRRPRPGDRRDGAAGPTADGTAMLVPRDAWDKLMDQLGNLHEAGQMLAEARERAARAETEAGFLRERLAEMRQERDGLRGGGDAETASRDGAPGLWARLRAAFRGPDPSDPA